MLLPMPREGRDIVHLILLKLRIKVRESGFGNIDLISFLKSIIGDYLI